MLLPTNKELHQSIEWAKSYESSVNHHELGRLQYAFEQGLVTKRRELEKETMSIRHDEIISIPFIEHDHYEGIYKKCYAAYEAACNERMVDPAYGYASPYAEEFNHVWEVTKTKEIIKLLKDLLKVLEDAK